ncbi:hypothetical protein MM188_003220 [Vibrio cholerae]|nr:hypothetical protein [Vibrio cholerae]
MNKQTVVESYLGSGVLYCDGRDIGNCSVAEFSIEQETKELPNYRGGGGLADAVTRIKKVQLKITTHTLNQENIAIAVRGTVQAGSVAAVSDAPVKVVLGGLTELPAMLDISKEVVVKKDAVVIAAEAGGVVNYQLTPAGIMFFAGVADGDAVTVSFTPRARNEVQALMNSGKEFRIVFNGMNEAKSGAPSIVRVHRWKPSPAESLSLIGEDFGELTLTGEVLADTTKPLGKSQFFVREDAV